MCSTMVEQVNVGFLNGHSYIDNTDKGSTRPVLNIEDAMEVDRVKEKELEQNQKTITLSAQTMSTDVDQVGDITAEKVIDTFPDQAVDFPGRRTSGRKRTTPNFYKSEPLPVKKDYKRLKKKADQQRAKKIASGKVVKEPSKNISKGKNVKVKKDNKDKEKKDKKGSKSQKDRKGDVKKGKKDPFIISLKLARKREAAPSFVKLETGSKELLWIKLSLRDFLIRLRISPRQFGVINDPSSEWNDYVYKAIISSLLRIVLNDATSIVSYAKHYLSELEKTPADSDKIWFILAEFLAHTELIEQERALKGGDFLLEEMDLSYMKPIYPTTDLAKVQAVTKLMFQAVSSETVRITIQEDTDSLKHAQHNANNKLKELKATWESQTSKLTQLMQKQTERQIQSSKDKLESLKQMYKMETRHIEQDLYQRKKRCTVRTIPLGMDKFQNRYWHFQQKSSEWITWGSWIICETGPGLKNPVADKPKRSRKKKTDIETEIKAENSQIKVMNGNGIAPQFELSDSNYNKSVDLSLVDSVKKEELKVKVNGDYQKESKANEVKKPQIKKQALVPNSSILKKEESLLRQPPHPNLKSNLFYVSGKENITQLAKWINCQYPVNEKTPVWVKYLDTYSAILDD